MKDTAGKLLFEWKLLCVVLFGSNCWAAIYIDGQLLDICHLNVRIQLLLCKFVLKIGQRYFNIKT